jgi:hypothetical protein
VREFLFGAFGFVGHATYSVAAIFEAYLSSIMRRFGRNYCQPPARPPPGRATLPPVS